LNAPPNTSGDESRTATVAAPRPRAFSRPPCDARSLSEYPTPAFWCGISPHDRFRGLAAVQRITRRGFGAAVLGGLAGAAASRLVRTPSAAATSGTNFTIATIPDPQFLAASCPDDLGGYYAALMSWIVDNRLIWINFVHLVMVSLLPFATS
jgi:hypothetical protein